MCIFCERAQNELAGGLTAAQKREVERCEQMRDRRVRATILTGFLGAGKTTFLNFVLKSWGHGKRIGVVQNEFGNVPVDDQLMLVDRNEAAEVITMPNGCLCCRVRGDVVDALRRLAAKPLSTETTSQVPADGSQLDNLIIECSGLSEVLPVAQTFFADPFVQAAFQLDGVVCVCDAKNFETFEGGAEDTGGPAVGQLLREQLAISDACLLNKCDLVDSAQRDRVSARIRALNPSVKVVPCRHGKVNLAQVLKIDSFSLETALSLDGHFLSGSSGGDTSGTTQSGAPRFCGTAPPVPPSGERHVHATFGSLGLEVRGLVDLEALKAWLRSVVERHGSALVRVKGVLRTGPDTHAIVQGVGAHIEIGENAKASAALCGTSRLVFIGQLGSSLSDELRAGFLGTVKGEEK